jgi:hypothetical protein
MLRMKKFLFVGFIFLTVACQSATATPASTPTSTLPPAPATATVTETLIPPPTPSPTPSPRFFTENFDLAIPDWLILQTSGENSPQVQALDGFLNFELDSPYTWVNAIYKAQEYTDVRIDAAFENRAAGPATLGLLCRYVETKGWYEFNISTDGTYNVLFGQFMSKGIASYTPIVTDTTEYLKPNEANYEIGLACTDNILWLYIRQKLFRKIDVTRFGLAEGGVGLTVSAFENTPVDIGFDWATISEP